MESRNFLDTLKLNNNKIIHYKIDPVSEFKLDAVVCHWKPYFGFDLESSRPKLMRQTNPICTFQEAGTKHRVYFQSSLNNSTAHLIGAHRFDCGSLCHFL